MNPKTSKSKRSKTLCNGPHCLICELYNRLSNANRTALRLYGGTSLSDSGCSLDLRFGSTSGCEFRVKLDENNLQTQSSDNRNQNKMCDYAVATRLDDTLDISVVELKRGAAKVGVIEQLQEGLKLLYSLLPQNVPVRAHAFLAAGKQSQQLKNQMRGSRALLSFGGKPIQLRIHKCGERVAI